MRSEQINRFRQIVRLPRQSEGLTYVCRKAKLFALQGPWYHYTYGRWRGRRWLASLLPRANRYHKTALLAQLNLEACGLQRGENATLDGQDDKVEAHVVDYFRRRLRPQFCFEPEQISSLKVLIDEKQQNTTIRDAQEVCRNIFRFRGVAAVTFDQDIDWTYCPHGNIDWTWDLNRHTYFETLGRAYWYTGNERYAVAFRDLLLHWMANNPVDVRQPNWTSVFEVAFRINTWIWSFYHFRSTAAFDQMTCLTFLQGLLAHGQYVDTHLELHTRNNHLLLEAKALAMLGLLFPEFKDAYRWQQRGLQILYEQLRLQVCTDGVHGERTTHYHRVVAGELLELLVLLENNEVAIPHDIREILNRMVEFELWVTKPNGHIPLFADSALKDTHLRFSAASAGPVYLRRHDLKSIVPSLDESTVWLLGPDRIAHYRDLPETPGSLGSHAFAEGGYFIMRAGHGKSAIYLTFDCGPFGYHLEPHHGHADALSFELYAHGHTWLVDPGVYSTRLGQDWRQFFRSSRAHNTVVVDGQDQSILLDSRRVYRQARTTLHDWITSDLVDFVDGSHDGYERFAEPITHRRQILFVKPEYWVVIDRLTGQGEHDFDLYFHLMPGLHPELDPESGYLYTGNPAQPGLTIAPALPNHAEARLITGVMAPIQGWVSFFSGEKHPAPTLCYHQKSPVPVRFCTVLYPSPAKAQVHLTVTTLDRCIECPLPAEQRNLTGLRIETDRYVDYLLIDRGPAGLPKLVAGWTTDARLLYVRHSKQENSWVKIVSRGQRYLTYQGRPVHDMVGLAEGCQLDCGSHV